MFGTLSRTPYDLRFSLFGIPVNVTPWFWIGAVFLGWGLVREKEFDLLAIWIGSLFVSILIHEMGHALTAKAFGWPPEVFLYQFGGLALYHPRAGYTATRSVLISFAGPAAGFLLFGLVVALSIAAAFFGWFSRLDQQWVTRITFLITQLIWINLFWGLVNLLPAIPLDGGRIAETILIRLRPYDGHRIAYITSIVVSGGVVLLCLAIHEQYVGILFGLICISNVQALQSRAW